ncbi:hypothetical protein [Methylobacterium crusticola]|uniref:hypothetical protein n=1 Tax=Methylobacterium crusticola TaxID=1697972 RepID=UPI001FD190A2|nr:hypothetical protein [Methylobacterium crusticola]
MYGSYPGVAVRDGIGLFARRAEPRCCHIIESLVPMRFAATLTTLALALTPLPTLASSCAQQIGTIERRLDSAGAVQITGLQAGHILQTGSPRAVQTIRLDAPSNPEMISNADRVAVGRILIVRAADEDHRGDKRACENTMTEAKSMIGALP